ncbi:hypothetical protein BHM03_00043464 [Ensete ventricosum]|nr:hypothetical protein BHM03_00043464 [Ensete ventricosum]
MGSPWSHPGALKTNRNSHTIRTHLMRKAPNGRRKKTCRCDEHRMYVFTPTSGDFAWPSKRTTLYPPYFLAYVMSIEFWLTAELDLLVEVVDVDSHVGRSVTAATAPSIVAHPSPLLPLMPIEIRGKSNRQAMNRTRHWSSATSHMVRETVPHQVDFDAATILIMIM